jgi:ATPase subunit of ABC transporter with duplicated ATPase domains
LIVTHDRYFIEQFADRVLEVVDGGVRLVGVRSGQAGPGVGPQ